MKIGTVAVEGRSMLPTYGPGDWLLVRWGARPRVGGVVLARRGDGARVIKRVSRREEHGWWLEGDNPEESIDSRNLGPFADAHIEGVVLFRYRRGDREGS